jgi:hypothetical protein
MSASLLSQSVFGRLLELITSTQFFIFIFMSFVTKTEIIGG